MMTPAPPQMPAPKPLPSFQLLNELLCYDTETGTFSWKVSRRQMRAGDKAGSISSRQGKSTKDYIVIRVDGNLYKAHRIAWLMGQRQDPGNLFVDHINGNGLDNRLSNLRLCTASENLRNTAIYKTNTSGYKGVSYHSGLGKWCSYITANKKRIHLGVFDTPELAHAAYCKAALELHGKFARAA